MKTQTIIALVDRKGAISVPAILQFKEAVAKFSNREVGIDIHESKHTSPQNRTLHRGIRIFAEGLTEQGNKTTLEDLKYELGENGFFGWVEYQTEKGLKRRPKSTSELHKDESCECFNNLQIAAAKRDIIIPDPEQKDFL